MPIYLTDSPSLYNLLYSPIQPLLLRRQRSKPPGISRRLCIPPALGPYKSGCSLRKAGLYLYLFITLVHILFTFYYSTLNHDAYCEIDLISSNIVSTLQGQRAYTFIYNLYPSFTYIQRPFSCYMSSVYLVVDSISGHVNFKISGFDHLNSLIFSQQTCLQKYSHQ